jgi:DNA invertase Pin-like site-specific DNA recombinase
MRVKTPPPPELPPIAISYVRFSTPEQAEGDSLRRQTADTEAWCQRSGIPLDTSLSIRDLGVSAFKGKHRSDKAALGGFLEAVRRGRVPRGSYLVIENLDRLSREDERTALRLWLDILDAGVNIVQLHPETVFRHERSDMADIIRAIIELSRGHSESVIKSGRIAKAWEEKRRKARLPGAARVIATGRLPGWVDRVGGRLILVPERADVVRRIFDLACGGYGIMAIVKRLTADGVPAFVVPRRVKKTPPSGRSAYKGEWTRSFVADVLADRRVLGEYQPYRDGEPDGEPIRDYYPAVVTEREFYAARDGAARRRRGPGRPEGLLTKEERESRESRRVAAREGRRARRRGEANRDQNVYPFSGLVFNASGGDPYYVAAGRNGADGPRRLLVNANAIEGRGRCHSFPLTTFERAVLSMLREVNPREVLGEGDGVDEVAVLDGRLELVRAKIAELEAALEEGEVAAVARKLREREAEEKELIARRDEASRKAASPLSEAWGEARSLLTTLDDAPDPKDARLRLRAALRRVIDSIWMLVVSRGRDRLAAVQVWFAEGRRQRSYLILHRPPKANASGRTAGGWWARSLASDAIPGELDLRDRDHAARLEAVLAGLELNDPAE